MKATDLRAKSADELQAEVLRKLPFKTVFVKRTAM